MLDVLAEPQDCKACAATCPLKKAGCPFDLAQAALELRARLVDHSIPLAIDEAIRGLGEKAAACRLSVVEAVRAENAESRLAARIMAKLLAMNPTIQSSPATPPATAPPGSSTPSEDRRSRGSLDLYVNASDADLEERLLADPDVHGLCTHPKIRILNADEAIQALRPTFDAEPFKGFVAAIVKRHEPGSDLGRITIYYRGPSGADAQRILREKKAA